ncbi:Glycosyltransferase involved in cell wall bisynthesis [Pseudarthrobacter equi]|uniref:Glycosyltransferase involved in cell wall bisynthesis n=1 Tax=Pseudarthrobacter equi TaxID=728066 RepID=A0A1H2B4H6_9MICC|nr:glycosyltransferase [Pseudarthrobacter equi]SDT52839.1 Glycosyltransferase involved in cell wall bisynthesis [Pseudarthrobacter equi]
MKIIVVVPWAPSVTRPRSLGLISYLAKNHDVLVVGATWSASDAEELQQLPVTRVVAVPMKKTGAYWRSLVGLLKGRSLQQSYVDSPHFRSVLRQAVAEFRPDLAFFNVIRTAQFGNEVGEIPTVIDLDEFRSSYYELLSETSKNPMWRIIASLEKKRMREAEERVLAEFNRVIVSSPTDLQPNNPGIRLVRSPHALSSPLGSSENRARNDLRIIFVGRQSYRANAEAVNWFVREVLPGVLKRVPNAHLFIVGDAPPKSTRRLGSDNVTVTGRVKDVAEHYASATVSVIPVTMATGVQMKLIESMVMGTPVVATPIVARGAGVDTQHCYVASTAAEWIDMVVAALTDEGSSASLVERARTWVGSEYSVDSIYRSLDEALSGIAVTKELR